MFTAILILFLKFCFKPTKTYTICSTSIKCNGKTSLYSYRPEENLPNHLSIREGLEFTEEEKSVIRKNAIHKKLMVFEKDNVLIKIKYE